MSKRYDVMSPRPKKDGGTFWVRVGTAFEGDRGIQVIFDALPIPDKEGRVAVNLFEPREQSGGQRQQAPARNEQFDRELDDEVPF